MALLERILPELSRLMRFCATVMVLAALEMLMVSSASGATEPVRLGQQDFYADLAPYASHLLDEDHELTAEQAASPEFDDQYEPIKTNLIDFGFNLSKHWIKVPLFNPADVDGTWKLTHDAPIPDPLEVYLVRDEDGKRVPDRIQLITLRDPFTDRPERHRHHASTIQLFAGEKATLLIGYASPQTTQMPLIIETPERFYERIKLEDIHILGLLALIAGMALISTIYLVALGQNGAYFYFAYILAGVIFVLHVEAYTFQYFWPGKPEMNAQAVAIVGFSVLGFGNLFAWSFINARKYHPVLKYLLPAGAILTGTMAFLSVWYLGLPWYKKAGLLIATCSGAMPVISGFFAMRRGHPGARLYMAGTFAILLWISSTTFGYLNPGLFNQDIIGHVARYALLFEGVMFSLAIFVQTQRVRLERDDAMLHEIELGSEKLALSEALRNAEVEYGEALRLAETQQKTLATTAHDIRQPLTSLRLALLKLNKDDNQTARQLMDSFDYLDGVVSQSLQSSLEHRQLRQRGTGKTEAPGQSSGPLQEHCHGEIADEVEEFPASIVLRNVAAMFAEEARDRGVSLDMVDCLQTVKTRPLELMRILNNLVSNAIQHSTDGRILLGCRRRSGRVSFEVHNAGQGMTPNELGRMLQMHQRGSKSKGTGLGLAIVSELAERNGFDLDVRSDKSRGTVFSVSVPAAS